MVSVGYFATLTGSFEAVKSSGDALEAQKYAELKANELKLMDYADLEGGLVQDKWQDFPDGSGWQYHLKLGAEKVLSADGKMRTADVAVRRKGDSLPRFTMEQPVFSHQFGLPVGTILPFVGDLKKIPAGWFLCDGTNNTPDLRDRFLEGVANRYQFQRICLPFYLTLFIPR